MKEKKLYKTGTFAKYSIAHFLTYALHDQKAETVKP